VYSKDK